MVLKQISFFFLWIGHAGTVYLPNGYGVDIHNVFITLDLFLYNFFLLQALLYLVQKMIVETTPNVRQYSGQQKRSNTVAFSH